MTKNLVIVESPAKAKTINKYLGNNYKVIASFGHIRSLPSKNGSVDPNNDFKMTYEIMDSSKKHVKQIKDEVKNAENIILATDPDREGEAISWHIAEIIKSDKKGANVKRVTFNEITKKAVSEAMANPRDVDMNLVDAQQARLALDYLVGFTLSPILWKKLPGSKSAGRVQSVALRIICDREDEIEKFRSEEYWDIKANFLTKNKEKFSANLTHIDGKKLDKFSIKDGTHASSVAKELEQKKYLVESITKGQSQRNPYAPFNTSSLQQDASRKLGFSTKKTMQIAQKLYEGVEVNGETKGLITYMRTDGVTLSDDAIKSIREVIKKQFGANYLPDKARLYKSKLKNAQEAHEAIRPTEPELLPDKVKAGLDKDMFKLYELIWKRTVASQMLSAVFDKVTIDITSSDNYAKLRAIGSVIKFDGFLKLYMASFDDKNEEDGDDEDRILPEMKEKESLDLDKINKGQHFTEPPARYTEASLVKTLEELGIGRPSTYSSIISVLQEREYVRIDKKRFIPEERGRVVTIFLKNFFSKYVEYNFTANLEEDLDKISDGQMKWKKFLSSFWDGFNQNIEEVGKKKITEIAEQISISLSEFVFAPTKDNPDPKKCPNCESGILDVKIGKYGLFIGCSNYPSCNYISKLSMSSMSEENGENGDNQDNDTKNDKENFEDKLLGVDKKTGMDILLKKGPYGFYVQLGSGNSKKDKPKRASIPKHIDTNSLDLEKAEKLLSLPRIVGKHPDTGKEITASYGKFGPYLLHDGKYVNIKSPEDEILDIGINRAVALFNEQNQASASKGSGKSGKERAKAEPVKIVGKYPDDNKEIAIYIGKYGPYIKYDGQNFAMPKKFTVEDFTLEMAVELINKKK